MSETLFFKKILFIFFLTYKKNISDFSAIKNQFLFFVVVVVIIKQI